MKAPPAFNPHFLDDVVRRFRGFVDCGETERAAMAKALEGAGAKYRSRVRDGHGRFGLDRSLELSAGESGSCAQAESGSN